MIRSEKVEAIDVLKDRFSKMSSAVLVDYAGLTVAEVTTLREKFRESGVEYKVCKNTLIRLAVGEEPYADNLADSLKGMTAVAWSYEEPSTAARIIKDFRKDNEKLVIKAGILEGSVMDGKAVEDHLATMPSKDELRSTLLMTLMAPAQNMVAVINASLRDMVAVLDARRRDLEG